MKINVTINPNTCFIKPFLGCTKLLKKNVVKNICKLILTITLFSISIAEIKIGYIDSQVIMTQYEDVRQVQVELEKEQKRLEALYTKKIASYDSLHQVFQTSKIIYKKKYHLQQLNDIFYY